LEKLHTRRHLTYFFVGDSQVVSVGSALNVLLTKTNPSYHWVAGSNETTPEGWKFNFKYTVLRVVKGCHTACGGQGRTEETIRQGVIGKIRNEFARKTPPEKHHVVLVFGFGMWDFTPTKKWDTHGKWYDQLLLMQEAYIDIVSDFVKRGGKVDVFYRFLPMSKTKQKVIMRGLQVVNHMFEQCVYKWRRGFALRNLPPARVGASVLDMYQLSAIRAREIGQLYKGDYLHWFCVDKNRNLRYCDKELRAKTGKLSEVSYVQATLMLDHMCRKDNGWAQYY
jgi:hypothetical protein